MNKITDSLYITKATSLMDLEEGHDFDEVISLSYRDHLGLEDEDPSTTGDKFVFPDGPHDYEVFKAAVEYTIEALNDEKKVLVHCQAGVSRSCGICTTAIATLEGESAEDAYEKVKESRSCVNPTDDIWDSVKRYTDNNNQHD